MDMYPNLKCICIIKKKKKENRAFPAKDKISSSHTICRSVLPPEGVCTSLRNAMRRLLP